MSRAYLDLLLSERDSFDDAGAFVSTRPVVLLELCLKNRLVLRTVQGSASMLGTHTCLWHGFMTQTYFDIDRRVSRTLERRCGVLYLVRLLRWRARLLLSTLGGKLFGSVSWECTRNAKLLLADASDLMWGEDEGGVELKEDVCWEKELNDISEAI